MERAPGAKARAAMFLFGKKKEDSPKKGPSLLGAGGGPSPIVYRERSADNFQQDELNRLRGGTPQNPHAYSERVVGQEGNAPQPGRGAASPQPQAAPRAGADDGDRDRQFDSLKKQLEIALREGDTDRIIEGYRNLGQHFMAGKTLAEQQAAKQMFEKALEHAGSRPCPAPCAARRDGDRFWVLSVAVVSRTLTARSLAVWQAHEQRAGLPGHCAGSSRPARATAAAASEPPAGKSGR